MVQIKGIDVSHWQGQIDWNKVKNDGVQFAFIKATENGSFIDERFIENVTGANKVGIKTGAYHFGRFGSVKEARSEASHFLNVVKDVKLTYPLVLDIEVDERNIGKKLLTDAAIAFLEAIENAGYFVMLYSNLSFLDNHLDESRLKPYALWVARYNDTLGRKVDVWQYSDSGKVKGIKGNVDLDWAYRDFANIINKMKVKYVILPETDSSWRVYPTDKAPIKGNEKGFLNPKKFGGLKYEILDNPQKDVYTIKTDDFGIVNIYAAPSTGAVIK